MSVGELAPTGERDRNWYDNQFDQVIDIVKLSNGIRSRRMRLGETLNKTEKTFVPEPGYLFSVRFARPLTRIEVASLTKESADGSYPTTHLEVGEFGASHGLPKFTSDLIEVVQPQPNQFLGGEYTRIYAYSPDRRYRLTINEESQIKNILVEDGQMDAINGDLEEKIARKRQQLEADDDIPF